MQPANKLLSSTIYYVPYVSFYKSIYVYVIIININKFSDFTLKANTIKYYAIDCFIFSFYKTRWQLLHLKPDYLLCSL